jgi:hypothetical protein
LVSLNIEVLWNECAELAGRCGTLPWVAVSHVGADALAREHARFGRWHRGDRHEEALYWLGMARHRKNPPSRLDGAAISDDRSGVGKVVTIGWILEDAWDAYLEAQPTAEPPPPELVRIRCPFCAASFRLARELTDHFGDQHHGERPVLLLQGREPAQLQQHRIGTSLRRADVILQNCSTAVVSINAGPQLALAPAELPKLLSSQTDALIDLQLANQFDPAAQPIPATYRIVFSIPEKRSLDAVDRVFQKHLAIDSLDFIAVDRFLCDRACAGLGRAYAGALADYVRGLLTKDRPYHLNVTMPFTHYRALYNQSLDGLQPYRRPLPDLVCAVIRFAQNNFSAPSMTGFPLLDGAVRSLAACVLDDRRGTADLSTESGPSRSVDTQDRVEICPLDDGVSRVLDLWTRLQERRHWTQTLEDECRQASNSATLDAQDKEKVLALWALAALRAFADATEPLSRLAATFPFGPWASLEREKRIG